MRKLCKLIILFLMILMINQNILATDKQLYLLTGTPTPKSGVEFPTYLYKVDEMKKKLALVREVISKDQGTEFIRPYYDERIIIIESKSGNSSEGNFAREFVLVSMNEPQMTKRFSIVYPDTFSEIEAHLFNIPSKGLYQGIYLSRNKATEIMLLGMNLSTMKQEELSWDVYKYIVLSGFPGRGTAGGDFLVISSSIDGKLAIPFRDKKIEANWQLPDAIKLPESDVVLFVNNDEILALVSAKDEVKKPSGLGYSTVRILNKKTQKWSSVQFKGAYSAFRGFGIWLAGYVADEKQNIDTPGKEKWRKEMTKTGTPVKWRFEDNRVYVPGILFLYNAETQQKYEIETSQGDSEVLLVEGDTVYYRVYDEIYKAKIGKNKIEPGILLVKDEVVPDIHWAFMGPE